MSDHALCWFNQERSFRERLRFQTEHVKGMFHVYLKSAVGLCPVDLVEEIAGNHGLMRIPFQQLIPARTHLFQSSVALHAGNVDQFVRPYIRWKVIKDNLGSSVGF